MTFRCVVTFYAMYDIPSALSDFSHSGVEVSRLMTEALAQGSWKATALSPRLQEDHPASPCAAESLLFTAATYLTHPLLALSFSRLNFCSPSLLPAFWKHPHINHFHRVLAPGHRSLLFVAVQDPFFLLRDINWVFPWELPCLGCMQFCGR